MYQNNLIFCFTSMLCIVFSCRSPVQINSKLLFCGSSMLSAKLHCIPCINFFLFPFCEVFLVYFGSLLFWCLPTVVVIYPHGCWVDRYCYAFIAYYCTSRNPRPPQGLDIEHLSPFWMAWQFKEASPVGPFLIMPNKLKQQCSRIPYLRCIQRIWK